MVFMADVCVVEAGNASSDGSGDLTVHQAGGYEPYAEQDLWVGGRGGVVGCVDEVSVCLFTSLIPSRTTLPSSPLPHSQRLTFHETTLTLIQIQRHVSHRATLLRLRPRNVPSTDRLLANKLQRRGRRGRAGDECVAELA